MKRAMENQSKSAVLQWIIPFAVPMVVVLVILFNFAVKSKESAQQIVTDRSEEHTSELQSQR